jgi:hypothetical protein
MTSRWFLRRMTRNSLEAPDSVWENTDVLTMGPIWDTLQEVLFSAGWHTHIYIYANIYAYVYPYNYESVHSVLVTEVCNTKARFTQWPPRQILAPAGQGDILMQTSRLCIWNSHAAMLGMLHAQCTSRRSHVSEMFWEIGPIGRPRLGDAKTNGSIKQHVKTNGWCFWASPSWSLSFRAEKT